jgi:hypothetical protein
LGKFTNSLRLQFLYISSLLCTSHKFSSSRSIFFVELFWTLYLFFYGTQFIFKGYYQQIVFHMLMTASFGYYGFVTENRKEFDFKENPYEMMKEKKIT